jgi:hypothetical protein
VRVEREDDAIGLQGVRGDDQVMCATGLAYAAGVCDEARMAGRGPLGVVEHINRRDDGDQRPRPVSRTLGTVRQFDADPIPGDGYGPDGECIRVRLLTPTAGTGHRAETGKS